MLLFCCFFLVFATVPLLCLVCFLLVLACCAARRRSLINARCFRRRTAWKLKFLYLSFLCCLCFLSCTRASICRIVVTLMGGMCPGKLCNAELLRCLFLSPQHLSCPSVRQSVIAIRLPVRPPVRTLPDRSSVKDKNACRKNIFQTFTRK